MSSERAGPSYISAAPYRGPVRKTRHAGHANGSRQRSCREEEEKTLWISKCLDSFFFFFLFLFFFFISELSLSLLVGLSYMPKLGTGGQQATARGFTVFATIIGE